MSRGALVAAFVLLSASPLRAQAGREHFIQPDTALDARHAVQRDAFQQLWDSTSTISAAGARLMSDLTSSSSLAWMRSRAGAVARACARSVSPLAEARDRTLGATWPLKLQQQARAKLLKDMVVFEGDLAACQKRWTSLAADTSQVSLRENAPYQMKLLQRRLDEFNRTAQTYLQYIGAKLSPQGATKS
jgi:hypothetical protein